MVIRAYYNNAVMIKRLKSLSAIKVGSEKFCVYVCACVWVCVVCVVILHPKFKPQSH